MNSALLGVPMKWYVCVSAHEEKMEEFFALPLFKKVNFPSLPFGCAVHLHTHGKRS